MGIFNFLTGKRHKLPQHPRPQWLNALLLIFLAYAFTIGMRDTPDGKPSELKQKIDNVGEKISTENIEKTIDVYRSALFPTYAARMDTKDTRIGKGAPIICGQEATIAYSTQVVKGRALPFNASKDAPLVFRLGEGKTIAALQQGVAGMRVGGKRTLVTTPSMSYGVKAFSQGQSFEAQDLISIELELLASSPETPDLNAAPFRIMDVNGRFIGSDIICGQPAKLLVTLWDMAGNKLFSTPADKPLTFTPGKSEVFLGLEQGIIGMARGAKRTLVVPPVLQKTLLGNAPTIDFPLPKEQTVLVDVEALP